MEIFPGISLFDTVTFSLYPNTQIGTTFTHVKLLGVIDFDTVRGFIDPVAQHEDIIPNLPAGSIDNPRQYTYLKIGLPNGDNTYVGMPWVQNIEKVERGRLQITLNNISPDDVQGVLAALSSNGFSVDQSEFV